MADLAAAKNAVVAAGKAAASGDSLGPHVVAAAGLGEGISSVAIWILQLCHLDPPTIAAHGIAAICVFLASYLMQKVSQ